MTRQITAEQATPAVAEHGEGPVWDASTGVLASVDMLRGDLLTIDLLRDGTGRGEVRRRHVGDVLAALRPRARGGWVVALERGFGLLDEPGSAGDGPARSLGELWSDEGVRMNDGGCDPAGGFWCGSMAYDAAPGRGALYRLAPDGSVATMLTGITVSNGLCWTPDGAHAYYVDSDTGRIDVLTVDLAAPAVTSREKFVDVEGGTPDGLTVDAEGGVWVALWGGSAVHRYAADGALDAVVQVPTTHPTACAFAGPELDELWITTSATGAGVTDGRAGALYRCRPGVRGVEPFPYQG
ncbi:MAG TPA: SMP-30/gluconolactonase/LRE family protein [Pseudonocardia sp.]|uniref:SMP-30/gluconolactonase/LRE family protein n=1 Tax=Pseudonocardia sp. TaxID=60912 RepID=UPI002B4B7422|nr:SMP-30/gluconolactonase/LRE family protein [Pseudonocardia sp.]HLU57436.1 SMP-30/gluconolactonase/LRE family protein [Pseudonocardia sp.]